MAESHLGEPTPGSIYCAQCGSPSTETVNHPPQVGHWETTKLYEEGWHARRVAAPGHASWDKWYCSRCWYSPR